VNFTKGAQKWDFKKATSAEVSTPAQEAIANPTAILTGIHPREKRNLKIL
jgi:hypothetical protein